MALRRIALLVVAALAITASANGDDPASPAAVELVDAVSAAPVDSDGEVIPPVPELIDGPLSAESEAALETLFATVRIGIDRDAAIALGDSGDVRLAWLLTDLMRFFPPPSGDPLSEAYERLSGTTLTDELPWQQATDRLIAWDVPAPPGYVDWKRIPFEIIEPQWEPFFDDADADIDWRILSWGGVRIDDRPWEATDAPCPGGCIPALDDPAVTDAAGGDWYDDDRVVFGVVVDGEARAYPKNVMEVHEMVNDTLGGRRLAMPYCTLCGSAQAYYTDDVDGFDTLELRTSGLLSRSNKVMFDLDHRSIIDTFTGVARSGPLHDAGVELEQITVVASTWGAWKAEHPGTTIVAEDGGIGRSYPDDPLRGRDDAGPIFPTGDVDPRLDVQAPVVGVIASDDRAVAFDVAAATAATARGERVEALGVTLVPAGDGFAAIGAGGDELVAHQAFWFAWSQFHPDTAVWIGPDR